MTKKKEKENTNNSTDKLNIIYNLIKTDSDSVDFIKDYLVKEYCNDSMFEYVIVSQVIDIFIRLNRLQFHIKNLVEYRKQNIYNEEINNEIKEYEDKISNEVDNNKFPLIDKNDNDYYDWNNHNNLVRDKHNELESKLYDYRKINKVDLAYFEQQKNIRDEEKHLIDCLIKYLNLLENRKQEAQNKRLRIEIIKAQINSKREYDY